MKKIIFALLMFLSGQSFASNSESELCKSLKTLINEGDLVFLDIDNYFFKKVASATNTWTSHVGIALKDDTGWVIYESTVPFSKKTDFCKYVDKTDGNHVAIKRLKGTLLDDDIKKIKASAEQRLGILYHPWFDFESKKQFCSKFVHEVFSESINVRLGEVVSFKDLLEKNPEYDLAFWQIWFLGSIPWERKTVTPKDVLDDSDLDTVWDWNT